MKVLTPTSPAMRSGAVDSTERVFLNTCTEGSCQKSNNCTAGSIALEYFKYAICTVSIGSVGVIRKHVLTESIDDRYPVNMP